jgi:hypothetical protein
MHFNYNPDSTCRQTGRDRAVLLYPDIGKCEMCDNPATDRHHKNDDTFNNSRTNLMFLCRYHHMVEDGRLSKLLINGKKYKLMVKKQCINCGIMIYPLRRGRCHACNEYYRRNGKDRLLLIKDNQQLVQCQHCNNWFSARSVSCKYCNVCKRKLSLKYHAEYEKQRRFKLKQNEFYGSREV